LSSPDGMDRGSLGGGRGDGHGPDLRQPRRQLPRDGGHGPMGRGVRCRRRARGLVSPALVLLGTFGYCIVSGFVPFVHAEAYLLIVSALVPTELRLPLVFCATFGQMIAKAAMYGVGRGILK